MIVFWKIMINVTAGCCNHRWFGVAWIDKDLVATARGSTRTDALSIVERCVPRGIKTIVVNETYDFAAGVVAMLGELEKGNEDQKRFTLSEKYLTGPLRRILTAAAAIPIGYCTTYGNIAKAAGSEARAVGRVMATNPLYPIVPCHRVVGADMLLVGYGGKQSAKALGAKLARIEAEARGVPGEKNIALSQGTLTVFPAERVIETALAREKQEQERRTAERMQLDLF